jgi:dTDP-4-amino-4,6-dideoxygalactose transaminase
LVINDSQFAERAEIIAAFLWAQLENLDDIQNVRKMHWEHYHTALQDWASENEIYLPNVPSYASNNGHMFYLVCKNLEQRTSIIEKLKSKDILSVFHYISLYSSPLYSQIQNENPLPQSDRYSDYLLRLLMYYVLEVYNVVKELKRFLIH